MSVAVDKLAKPLAVFKNYERREMVKLDALLNDKDITSMSAADFKPLDQQASAAKKKGCCLLQPNEKSCSDLQGTCATGGPAFSNMGDLKGKLEGAISDMTAAEEGSRREEAQAGDPGSVGQRQRGGSSGWQRQRRGASGGQR